jgi:hypothetical protein
VTDAVEVLDTVAENDLVIRDLGYYAFLEKTVKLTTSRRFKLTT